MDHDSMLGRIVEDTYHAAANPSAWHHVLADVGTLLDSHCANLAVLRHDRFVCGTWHGFPAYSEQVRQDRVAANQWRRSLLKVKGAMPVGVHFGSEGISHRELVATRFYNDYCRPCDIDYSVAACFLSEFHDLGILAVYRGHKRGDYGAREGRLLGRLLPHLVRATEFAARLQRIEQLRLLSERAWDTMPWGILLLGAAGQILFANRRAEEILGQGDGLAVRHGRIVATASAEATRLVELLRRASRPRAGPRTGDIMPVARRGGRRPLQLWAMPLPSDKPDPLAAEPGATTCALLIDSDCEVAPPTESLKALHGLTCTEAELVAALLRGERLDDYADHRRVTLNTARTQLKSVFAKTDTRSQAELIRLLSSAPLLGEH